MMVVADALTGAPETILLLFAAVIGVVCHLEAGCGDGICQPVNGSCLEEQSYRRDECFPNVTIQPKIPDTSDKVCTACSPLAVRPALGALVKPSSLRSTIAPVDPAKYKITIYWNMTSKKGLTGFWIKVYEEEYREDVLIYEHIILCLCMDKMARSFEFERLYRNRSGCKIRVEIISEQYILDYIDLNLAKYRLECPADCSNVPGSDHTTCNIFQYSQPTVHIQKFPLFSNQLDGRNSQVMSAIISWSDNGAFEVYSGVQHYFMLAPITESLTCNNTGVTICFSTNHTSITLNYLNASMTYKFMIESYTPCFQDVCRRTTTYNITPLDHDMLSLPGSIGLTSTMALKATTTTTASQRMGTLTNSFVGGNESSATLLIATLLPLVLVSAAVLALAALGFVYGIFFRHNKYRLFFVKGPSSCSAGNKGPSSSGAGNMSTYNAEGVLQLKPAVRSEEVCLEYHSKFHASENNLDLLGMPKMYVAYSSCSIRQHREAILHFLVNHLRTQQNINACSHDFLNQKHGISAYSVESQISQSSAVLCVCDEAFYDEWNGKIDCQNSSVYYVKSLLAANLQCCQGINKYAVVLLKRGHEHFIPTGYLGGCKRFYVTDVEDIANFVRGKAIEQGMH